MEGWSVAASALAQKGSKSGGGLGRNLQWSQCGDFNISAKNKGMFLLQMQKDEWEKKTSQQKREMHAECTAAGGRRNGRGMQARQDADLPHSGQRARLPGRC